MTRPPNAGAQLYRTSTTPPFTICLRPHQEIDDKIRMSGVWPDCAGLPELIARRDAPTGRRRLFVDVGANIGACSLWMAALGHVVIGFEPVGSTFAALSAGLAANLGHPNGFATGSDVRLIHAAVSDAIGTGFIQSNIGNSGDSITAGVAAGGRSGGDGARGRVESRAGASPYGIPDTYWALPGHRSHNYTRHPIHLTTLDRSLPTGVTIDLLKVDSQVCVRHSRMVHCNCSCAAADTLL